MFPPGWKHKTQKQIKKKILKEPFTFCGKEMESVESGKYLSEVIGITWHKYKAQPQDVLAFTFLSLVSRF